MKKTNLSKRIDVTTSDVWYDPVFRIVLEQHLHFLINDPENTTVEINPVDNDYYKGNFHGLLYKNEIPIYLHWIITRMNGLDSSSDYKEDMEHFIVPNVERLNRLREIFLTNHNIY